MGVTLSFSMSATSLLSRFSRASSLNIGWVGNEQELSSGSRSRSARSSRKGSDALSSGPKTSFQRNSRKLLSDPILNDVVA